MPDTDGKRADESVKAFLVDPASMTVVWMNEPAQRDVPEADIDTPGGLPVAQAIPLAQRMGVMAALPQVAETGESQHLQASLVSTRRGALAVVTSVHRLPDGKLLLLTDHAYQLAERAPSEGSKRRPGRGAR